MTETSGAFDSAEAFRQLEGKREEIARRDQIITALSKDRDEAITEAARMRRERDLEINLRFRVEAEAEAAEAAHKEAAAQWQDESRLRRAAEAKLAEAQERIAAFEAGQKPLEGDARSRILRRLGVADVDEALSKINTREAEVERLREALVSYDSLSLVIESAVRERRDRDPREACNYEALLRTIDRARAALRGGGE